MHATSTYRAGRCPVCRCVVIVWRRVGCGARLLRTLAMADHIHTMHSRAAAGR